MTLYRWDKATPGNNATADSTIGWSEGQAPSTVNDSARGMMTAVAKFRDDVGGALLTTGTSTAYALTTNQVFSSLSFMNGQVVSFTPHVTCGATVTLNVDSLGAKPLRLAPAVELAAGNLVAGANYIATYNNSSAVWYLAGVYSIAAAASSITTAMLQDDAVTYAKIQNVTNARLLGNFSGSTADVSEYAVAGGIGASGSTLTFGLPAQSSFRNLSIKVTSSTAISVAADFVVMYDSSNVPRTAAISASIDMTTSAVVNGRDGSLAAATWYYIYAISNGTTDGALASTSATSPTLPSGYTFKARIGAVQTLPAATTLYGTWQLGNRAQYIAGLAGTTGTLMSMVSGASGSSYSLTSPTLVAVSTVRFVPTTASHIRLAPSLNWKAGGIGSILLAPSSSYSGTNNGPNGSNGLFYPFVADQTILAAGSAQFASSVEFMLESTSIYYAGGAGCAVGCLGWTDNI